MGIFKKIADGLDAITSVSMDNSNTQQNFEIVMRDDERVEQAEVDMSWVEDQIAKMKMICNQIEKKYGVPPRAAESDGREFYSYLFPEQKTNKCPVCGHDFEKFLQRATNCPDCGEYLRVRYGFLLSDADIKRAHETMVVGSFLWRYRCIEPDQLRMFAKYGMEDSARNAINEFSEKAAELL